MSAFTLQEIQLIQDCVRCEIDEQESMLTDVSNNTAKDILFHTNEIAVLECGLKRVENNQPLNSTQQQVFIELVTSYLIMYVVDPVQDINNPTIATALNKIIG